MIRVLLCLLVFVCYSFNVEAVVLQSPDKAFSYKNTRKNKKSSHAKPVNKPIVHTKTVNLTSSIQETVFVKKDFVLEVSLENDACCHWKIGNSSSAILTSDTERGNKKILKFKFAGKPYGEIYFDKVDRSTGNVEHTKLLHIQGY